MFQRRPSQCVAILTMFFQQITHYNYFSVSLGQHDFKNFCNLSRLISKKGGFTPWKRNFSIEKSILGRKLTTGKVALQSNVKF